MLCVQSLHSCPPLCDLMDCSSPQASLSMQILQARTLEWIAMPSSKGSSQPRHRTLICCIGGRFFTAEPPGKPHIRVCPCTGRVCTRWAWESQRSVRSARAQQYPYNMCKTVGMGLHEWSRGPVGSAKEMCKACTAPCGVQACEGHAPEAPGGEHARAWVC